MRLLLHLSTSVWPDRLIFYRSIINRKRFRNSLNFEVIWLRRSIISWSITVEANRKSRMYIRGDLRLWIFLYETKCWDSTFYAVVVNFISHYMDRGYFHLSISYLELPCWINNCFSSLFTKEYRTAASAKIGRERMFVDYTSAIIKRRRRNRWATRAKSPSDISS